MSAELIERIEGLIYAAGVAGLSERREGLRDALDVIRRAPVSAGKVKALQFEGHNGFWRADDGIGGFFEVTEVGGAFHMCRVVHGHANKLIPYQSQKAAFAACQVEHDRRILAALQPGDGWQDISSAPKGQDVLLACPSGVRIDYWALYCRHNVPKFTHWMPLPAPPAIPQGEETR